MTVTISLAGTADGHVTSHNATYATMLAGSNLTSVNTPTVDTWGQTWNFPFVGEYAADQAFYEFPYTKDATQLLDSAYIQFMSGGTLSSTQTRDMQIREYDFGGVVDTTDWRTPAAFNALTLLATCPRTETAGVNAEQRAGHTNLITRLDTTGNLRVIVCSNRFGSSSTPSTDERADIYSADSSGTSQDPALIYTTTPLNLLNRTLGAQAQLSDGTHVVLESLAAEAILSVGNIKLRRVSSAGTATDIATLSISGSAGSFATLRGGAQTYALAVDASDNIYVICRQGGNNSLCAQAFIKGAGLTWTTGTRMVAAMGTYDAELAQWAATWQSVGGTAGTLVVVATGTPGTDNGIGSNAGQVALVNCDSLLAGTGSVLRGTAAFGAMFVEATNGDHSYWQNDTLTGLDLAAAPGDSRVGYAISYNGDDGRNYMDPAVTRYKLATDGASILGASTWPDEWDMGTVARDANSKLRVVGIDTTRFATAGGLYPFRVLQVASDGSTQTKLGEASLASLTVASKPATIYNTQTWDLVYDAGGNRLWFYYIDASRRLVRTSFNVTTLLANNDEIVVSAAVGAAGSTNYAIRCARGKLTSANVLVTIANKTSGGAHSIIYQTDTLNVPPNAPTLTPKANYDATTAGTFLWTFSDPNPGDTQSAFQLEISNASTGAVVHDTGKVTSTTSSRVVAGATLTNGVAYQWRVRTWDVADSQGAYSGYGTFSCAAGGTVTVTDPAADNPAGIITSSYLVHWSVASTTQQDYRVVLKRNDTGATISDTGYVTSVATQFNVTGMISDVENQVEVTVRNASLVVSATGIRKITPSFSHPEAPLVSVANVDDSGYLQVAITNPTPTGSKPEVTGNQVMRRLAGTSDPYVIIATGVAHSATYRDYAAGSGITYEYVIRGVTATGTTDSVSATGTLTLLGVWLHDPQSAQATVRQYLYGRAARSNGLDTMGQGTFYAGRELPVVDFGEFSAATTDAKIQVPNGPTWYTQVGELAAFAALRRTVCYRDNRGRRVFGTLSGFKATDEEWGSTVDLTVTQVDYTEAVA